MYLFLKVNNSSIDWFLEHNSPLKFNDSTKAIFQFILHSWSLIIAGQF